MNHNSYCKILDSNLSDDSSHFFNVNNEKKFVSPTAFPHYAPDHIFEPNHIKPELRFDLDKQICFGETSLFLTTQATEAKTIILDNKGITIESVVVNGKNSSFSNSNNKLFIDLESSVRRNSQLEVVIHHYVEKPKAGLYFIRPDKNYPDLPNQIWTQCQDEDASYFFPCFDHPSFKQTSEIIGHIPKGWTALSNGDLIEKKENENESIFHYKFDIPHSTYLISFVAGEFTCVEDSWDNIKINFYVHPSRVEEGKRSFGKTPDIIKFFSEYVGVRYPYKSYSQIAVAEFIFGGMENTTVTTQTDLTLHDQRAHIDFKSESLVAHEAAHQFFGDLLTCKDWTHAWLNESFATYFDALYIEYSLGKDEFLFRMMENAEAYMKEDSEKYRRAIVTNLYDEPIEMFDRHLYPGGSWRLHMLRGLVGDNSFREVLKYYLEAHRYQTVETIDLQRAFEKVTGKNLDWFFDEFIYKAGYPELKIDYEYDPENKLLIMNVNQTQKIDSITPLFTIPIEIEVVYKDRISSFKIKIENNSQSFFFPSTERPLYVKFDPNSWVLKKLDLSTDKDSLIAQLRTDTSIIGRIQAAEALSKNSTIEIVHLLGEQLRKDQFWGVQQVLANLLGKINTKTALEELLDSLSVSHPKARRKIVSALGEYTDSAAATALINILTNGDESYFVEAEATISLGKTQHKLAYENLVKQLGKDSFQEVIRSGVFKGLSKLHDIRGLDLSIEWGQPGKPMLSRLTAIETIGELGKLFNKPKALDAINNILNNTNRFRIKFAVINSLEKLDYFEAIKILKNIQEQEADGRLRRAAYNTIMKINKNLEKSPEILEIHEEIEKLKKQNNDLKIQIEEIKTIAKK